MYVGDMAEGHANIYVFISNEIGLQYTVHLLCVKRDIQNPHQEEMFAIMEGDGC